MSRPPKADADLDALIEEVTVDAFNESEQLTAFETAFDEVAKFPFDGSVIGEAVEVLSLAADDDRGELVATCRRAGRRHKVALQDIEIRSDAATMRLLAAYKRWLGH